MRHMHGLVGLAAIGAAFLAGSTAAVTTPPIMNPVSQTRTLQSFVIVPPCGAPTTVSQSDSATDFSPYTAKVHAERVCAAAQGISSAHQQSTIEMTKLTANGTTHSNAAAASFAVIHAISSSLYQVQFSLSQTARFRLTAQLASGGALPVVYAFARVRLQNAALVSIVDQQVQPGPGGAMTTADIDQVLQLDAGTYTLSASSSSAIDSTVPPEGNGDSVYQVDFAMLDTADIDQDGDVDGYDLALVLGGWGGCPLLCPACCCPTDLNCDGITNGLDIAILLGEWNP